MSNPISPDKMAALLEVRDMFPGTESRAQCNRIYEFMHRGFMLSTFEASRHLDVYHCPARILQLRADGHNIITHRVTVVTEAGKPHRVGNYLLVPEVRHVA